VTPGYFRVMGIPLLAGRDFGAPDRAGAPAVVAVSEAFARAFWPAGAAVGKRISLAGPQGPWLEVVGVVGDVRMQSAEAPPEPVLYIPYAQKPWAWLSWATLVARAGPGRDPASLAPAIRGVLRALDAELPVHRFATVRALYAGTTASRRFATMLLGAFVAGLALVLGSIGMYGVLSFAVAQRRREIGIRIALGAAAGRVMGAVVRGALALALAGIAVGGAAAVALTRLLQALLYETSPTDPLTFGAVAVVLVAVAVAASLVPAWRAARVDPVLALRAE
jgi:predicted permease